MSGDNKSVTYTFVTFTHPRDWTVYDAEVDLTITVREALAELVQCGFLEAGSPHRPYRLVYEGLQLSSDSTLAGAGVVEGGIISVAEEGRGGGSATAVLPARARPRGAAVASAHASAPGGRDDRPSAHNLASQRAALQAKTVAVVEVLGSRAEVARILGVGHTQPDRWIRGTEMPTAAAWQRLADLEYVASRVALVWNPAMVRDWLTAPNAFLDGARPLDVLQLHGPAEVIAAVDAEFAGSYA